MFERSFQWGVRRGARVLFITAAAMLLISIWQIITSLLAHYQNFWASIFLVFSALSNAAIPFFGAVVIERIDLWLQRGGTVAVVVPASVPSRFARWGSLLLLALSLLYFAVAGVICTDWTAFVQGAWLGPLWQGSVLLFGSLVLDRLDRWTGAAAPR